MLSKGQGRESNRENGGNAQVFGYRDTATFNILSLFELIDAADVAMDITMAVNPVRIIVALPRYAVAYSPALSSRYNFQRTSTPDLFLRIRMVDPPEADPRHMMTHET